MQRHRAEVDVHQRGMGAVCASIALERRRRELKEEKTCSVGSIRQTSAIDVRRYEQRYAKQPASSANDELSPSLQRTRSSITRECAVATQRVRALRRAA